METDECDVVDRYIQNVYSRYIELRNAISMVTNEYQLENVENELCIEQERISFLGRGIPDKIDIALFLKSVRAKRIEFNLGKEQTYLEYDLKCAIRTRRSLEALCALRKYLPKKNGELDYQASLYKEWEENLKKFMPR